MRHTSRHVRCLAATLASLLLGGCLATNEDAASPADGDDGVSTAAAVGTAPWWHGCGFWFPNRALAQRFRIRLPSSLGGGWTLTCPNVDGRGGRWYGRALASRSSNYCVYEWTAWGSPGIADYDALDRATPQQGSPGRLVPLCSGTPSPPVRTYASTLQKSSGRLACSPDGCVIPFDGMPQCGACASVSAGRDELLVVLPPSSNFSGNEGLIATEYNHVLLPLTGGGDLSIRFDPQPAGQAQGPGIYSLAIPAEYRSQVSSGLYNVGYAP